MDIKVWIESRGTPGTLADMARRIVSGDKKYGDVENILRNLYVLEAVIRHGSQEKAAVAIGIHRNTVSRAMVAMGVRMSHIRKIAKKLPDASA